MEAGRKAAGQWVRGVSPLWSGARGDAWRRPMTSAAAVAQVAAEDARGPVRARARRQQQQQQLQQQPGEQTPESSPMPESAPVQAAVPVRAFYVARQLDMGRARNELAGWKVPFTLSRDCVIVHGGLDATLVNRAAAMQRKRENEREALQEAGEAAAGAARGVQSGSEVRDTRSSGGRQQSEVDTAAVSSIAEALLEHVRSEAAALQGNVDGQVERERDRVDERGVQRPAESEGEQRLRRRAASAAATALSSLQPDRAERWHDGTFTVLFGFGAVVTLNASAADREAAVQYAQALAVGGKVPGGPRQESYAAAVDSRLEEWSELGADKITVQRLDLNNVRVISTVLGQSVALDHYAQQVDKMLADFSQLNSELEVTGEMKVRRERLPKLVVQNNSMMHDVMLKLRLMDRSDAAWQFARYNTVWEAMRDEFMLVDRFETLDFKLNLIQHQVKFFLDVLQNRKSDSLEWIIIVLISCEIVVALYDILTR